MNLIHQPWVGGRRSDSRMRKRNPLLLIASGAAVALALASCSTAGPEAPGGGEGAEGIESVTLSFSDILSPSSPAAEAFRAAAEEAAEASGGQINFTEYFSATLLPGDEVLSGVGDGVADMGMVYSSYFPSELPIADWMNGLTMMYSPDFPGSVLEGAAASQQVAMQTPELIAEFERLNLKLLWAQDNTGPFSLMCTEPVETLADAQGMRVRTGGLAFVNEAEALGMVPVSLPISEMYEALQRDVVDCVISHPPTAIDSGMWEVAPHVTPAQFSGYNGNFLVMNLDRWNALSPEAQQIIETASQTMWLEYIQGNLAYYERFATEGPESHGTTFHDPTELNEALAAFHETALQDLVTNAPAGLTDAQATVDQFEQVQGEWAMRIGDAGVLPADLPESAIDRWASVSEIDFDAYAELIRANAFTTSE